MIWVFYAGHLHLRAIRRWTGIRSAWINITGFLAQVFNYTIVNLYFPSRPTLSVSPNNHEGQLSGAPDWEDITPHRDANSQ